MKLYGNDWGVYPRRITIYLREKGIESIDLVPVDLTTGAHLTPEYKAINPAGTIPALQLDDGTVIYQSTAIYEYLEEVFPTPNMIGGTVAERAHTRDLMSLIDDCYYALINYVRHSSPILAPYVKQVPEAVGMFMDNYDRAIDVLEAFVSDGPFLSGSRVTIADCSFFSLVQFCQVIHGISLPERCTKLNAFADAFAKRPSAKMGDDLPASLRKPALTA